MSRGFFIVFEGIDGSGKSTQARILAEYLDQAGRNACLTREPGESEAGMRLRRLAKEGRKGVSLEEETRLFQEDRAIHCAKVILPALERGEIVICDRYWFSTVAYQGALGADKKAIAQESREKFPLPDLVIYLRADVKMALGRIHRNRSEGAAPAYEKEAFLEKVLANYEEQVRRDWIVLDASRDEESLAHELSDVVLTRLP